MRRMEPDHYGSPFAKANLQSVINKTALVPRHRPEESSRLPDRDTMILVQDHVPSHPRRDRLRCRYPRPSAGATPTTTNRGCIASMRSAPTVPFRPYVKGLAWPDSAC